MIFRVPDPDGRWTAVRLASDVPAPSREFERHDGDWVLELPRELRVHRVEYELEVEHPDGGKEWIADPSHGTRAPGAFGEKSVLEAEHYERPWWLDAPVIEASTTRVPLGIAMRRRVTARRVGAADRRAAARPARPRRPGVRQARAADPLGGRDGRRRQAAAVPARDAAARRPRQLVLGVGGLREGVRADPRAGAARPRRRRGPARSAWARRLGALAMLHVHRRFPGVLGGLFLQSGSFFTLDDRPAGAALQPLRAHHPVRPRRPARPPPRRTRSRWR